MKSKYFTVEIKPTMLATVNGLHNAFGDNEVLFDWTSFEVPRGGGKLLAANIEMRPKGDSGTTPNIFPLELMFAKTKNGGTAPSTLGALGAAPTPSAVIGTTTDVFVGHMPIVAGNFAVSDQLALASAPAPGGLVLQGEPYSGSNIGLDVFYIAGIAGGAIDFVSTVETAGISAANQTVLDYDGLDARKIFQVGDVIHDEDGRLMGTIRSLDDDEITMTGNLANASVNDKKLYNINPIRILLTFEK